MTNSTARSKWAKACARLISATQTGDMIWSRVSSERGLEEFDLIDAIYEGEYRSESFRIFRYLDKLFNEDIEEYYRVPKFRLQLLGFADSVKYDVPEILPVEDLFDVVRFKAEGIDDVLNKLTQ